MQEKTKSVFEREMWERIDSYELSQPEYKIIIHLLARLPYNDNIMPLQSEIAEKKGLNKSVVSKAYKALEQKGIIKRKSHSRWLFNPELAFDGHTTKMNELINEFKTMTYYADFKLNGRLK